MLLDRDCPVRYVITVAKLREGWDCPFAYVLCSVAEVGTLTAVEQVLGRVLRMPHATKKSTSEALNHAYAFVTSSRFADAARSLADALVASGFTRYEAQFAIQQPLPGLLPGDPVNGSVGYPADLAQEPLGGIFSEVGLAAGAAVAPVPAKPAFDVPQLALWLDDDLEPVEQTHFLQAEWNLSECDPALTETEFPGQSGAPDDLLIDVRDGRVNVAREPSTFAYEVGRQLSLLILPDVDSRAALAVWLDKRISHPDVPLPECQLFLSRMIDDLLGRRGFTLERLSRRRMELRNAAASKIETHRKARAQKGFQALLFADAPARLEVSAQRCFRFPPDEYPLHAPYEGTYRFEKHYYRQIAAMNHEEESCARAIEHNPNVKTWVRNLERRADHAFWLPTPTDKFYPDFMVQLADGRVAAIEYKGAHLLSNDDTKEKQRIGDLWAARSQGHCLFLLVSETDYAARLATLGRAG